MTKRSLRLLAVALLFSPPGFAFADQNDEVLYAKLVQPILNAKCTGCHGADKQKGKLRLDSLEEVLKGSDGENVIPGKVEESLMTSRILLPKDDDEVMPPEDEPQLTREEIEVLKFWVQSGAKGDARIGDLKPAGPAVEAIKVVLANPPKAGAEAKPVDKPKEADPARLKVAQETIGKVEKTGASLMAIAQDTPQLRFSALNVSKEYGDENLKMLKPVADQILWMDLARTQVTDAGLCHLAEMKNLTRLHLENTKIGDAGLDHLKGLANLEYLNLYGTQVTDAGVQKLAELKKLKKLYLWQSKVTEEGGKKLAAQIPGLDVNTGWKEPVTVAAVTAPAKKEEPAAPAAPAKPEPKKEEPKKPAPTKPAPPAPAAKKEEPAKPAPVPAPAPVKPEAPKAEAGSLAAFGATIDKLLQEAKRVSAEASQSSAQASKAVEEVKKVAEASTKSAAEAKKVADEAKATAEAARKSAEEARKAASEAQTASEEARKIAGEARAALEKLRQAAAALAGKDDKAAK